MLIRAETGSVTMFFEGKPLSARIGDSVAAALLAHDIRSTRDTALSGTARGPYCMMGACFECLAVVDGTPNTRTCQTPVRHGMRVERQRGARDLPMTKSA